MIRPIILWSGFIEEDQEKHIDLPRWFIKSVMIDFRFDPPLYTGSGQKIIEPEKARVEIRADHFIALDLPMRLFNRFYPPLGLDGRRFSRIQMKISGIENRMFVVVYLFEEWLNEDC